MDKCCSDLNPSSIFNGVSFDALRIDGVADPLISVNKLATMDIEESYFNTAIEFIKESNRQYMNAKTILYKAIAESAGDDISINEGFSEFFGTVKDIISKFLKFIKSLFDKFINALMSLVGSEKYLIKNKKKLDEFRDGDEFEITGYTYTFNNSIPVDNAVLSTSNIIYAGLNPEDLDIDIMKGYIANNDLVKTCDKFRADILGKNGDTIDESDFAEELFKIFRNDELDSDKITINSIEFRNAKNRFFDYKKTKKDVEEHLKRINKAYNELEDGLRKFVKDKEKMKDATQFTTALNVYGNAKAVSPNNGSYSDEFIIQADLFMKNRADLVQAVSNIHALAFSAKLDALKDCYRQDKATLYKGLSMILRSDNARGLS
jgi:hypothetical protein